MRRLLFATLVVAGLGCAKSARLDAAAGAPCNSDADCSDGEVCLDVGCAAPDQNLVVEIIPGATAASTAAAQEFANVDASKPLDFHLGPPPALHLTSNLYPFTLSVNATPLFLTDFPTSLPDAVVTAETTLPVPMAQYALRATPADPLVPPIELAAKLAAPGAVLDLPLVFLDRSQLPRLSGELTAGPLLAANPELRYDVAVVHADGTPASQTVTTGQDGGAPLAFNLFVAPVDPGEQVGLSVAPHNGIGPTAIFAGTLQALEELLAQDGGASLGNAQPLAAHGVLVDGAGHGIGGATVRLVGTLPGGARFVSPPVTTEGDGSYRTTCLHDLHDGGATEAYQVLAVPPPAANLAISKVPATVTWSGDDSDFGQAVLAPLTDVSGRVLDMNGQPVSGATVQATPSAGSDLPLISANTTTAGNGEFHLPLTPGSYHFDFSPPLSLVAPSASRLEIVAGGSYRLPDLEFSVPRQASGSVTGPDDRPAEGALVRVYHVQKSQDAQGGKPTVRSTLLARSAVLHDGSFTVVLPSPPSRHK